MVRIRLLLLPFCDLDDCFILFSLPLSLPSQEGEVDEAEDSAGEKWSEDEWKMFLSSCPLITLSSCALILLSSSPSWIAGGGDGRDEDDGEKGEEDEVVAVLGVEEIVMVVVEGEKEDEEVEG